jgi:hypothetical protein
VFEIACCAIVQIQNKSSVAVSHPTRHDEGSCNSTKILSYRGLYGTRLATVILRLIPNTWWLARVGDGFALYDANMFRPHLSAVFQRIVKGKSGDVHTSGEQR